MAILDPQKISVIGKRRIFSFFFLRPTYCTNAFLVLDKTKMPPSVSPKFSYFYEYEQR